ncbi:MAG: hypothetical protein FWC80_05000 [Firmicutes bacterium]|nr:hypothetical protein [Bacillota bacterium]
MTNNRQSHSGLTIATGVLVTVAGFLMPAMLGYYMLALVIGGSGSAGNSDMMNVGGLLTLAKIIIAFVGAILGIVLCVIRNKKPIFVALLIMYALYFVITIGSVAINYFMQSIGVVLQVFSMIEMLSTILMAILILCAFANHTVLGQKNMAAEGMSPMAHANQNYVPPNNMYIAPNNISAPQIQPSQFFGQYHPTYLPQNQSDNGQTLGVLALVFGIISIMASCVPFVGIGVGSIPLICGILSASKKNGLGIAGLVLGSVAMVINLFFIFTLVR